MPIKWNILIIGLSLCACQRGSDFVQPILPPPEKIDLTEKPSQMDVVLSKNTSTSEGEKVDILFVIDNSGSMKDHQDRLKANTAYFINNFTQASRLDWKIGMISSDTSEEPYLGFGGASGILDRNTLNPVQVFQDTVGKFGTSSGQPERAFAPVLNAINRYPEFAREDAYLAVIMVTDEEEQSYEMSPSGFLQEIQRIKAKKPDSFLTYGLFAATESCTQGKFYYRGSRYEEILRLTSGKFYNLCDLGSGALLASLGQDLISQISENSPYIVLNNIPIVETLKVFYQGRELVPGLPANGGEWIYESGFNRVKIVSQRILKSPSPRIKIQFKIHKKRPKV